MTISRKRFLEAVAATSIGWALGGRLPSGISAEIGSDSRSFFGATRKGNRHWLVTPDGKPFWSIGINHVDSATLRYTESGDVWQEKYGNSMKSWLAEVNRDLRSWGFNTMGWNQEVVTLNDQNNHHSRSFTFEEYQWLDMPYCHLLPFIESHQWEKETRLPDIRSKGFSEWCDYVARDHCARMKDDPKLIGYFYTDCPTWAHSPEGTEWKAPLFDPELLKTSVGRRELLDLAGTYYRVTHEAVRRYDLNHMILGDRYEANRLLPEEVLSAAKPYVDVFAFQCFGDSNVVSEKLGRWAAFLKDKPILLADNAPWLPTAHPGWPPQEDRHIDPEGYRAILHALQEIPQCVGYHLCGAYLRNKARRYGLKDARDQVDPSTAGVQRVNEEMARWIEAQ